MSEQVTEQWSDGAYPRRNGDGMTTEADPGPRAFTQLVTTLADGQAHAELTEKLEALMVAMRDEAHVRNSKVKGKISLELNFTCEPSDVVTIDYVIRIKAPDPKRPGTVLWATKQGGLSPQNPRQRNFGELLDVSPKAQVRAAPTGAGEVKEA